VRAGRGIASGIPALIAVCLAVSFTAAPRASAKEGSDAGPTVENALAADNDLARAMRETTAMESPAGWITIGWS